MNMTDREIGLWSLRKFKCDLRQQWKKYSEEYKEVLFELADLWIVICGLKARGSQGKLPSYKTFCKQYSVEPEKLRVYINKKLGINDKAKYVNINGVLKRMKTPSEMQKKMFECAEERGVVPSLTMEKIANFRVRQNIPISVCPCAPNDKERGCISDKCYKEILETGTCHCKAFIRQGIDITTLK